MFHRILVPLDGSELAERALKPALKLSKAAKGELLLLSISYLKHAFVEERAGIGFLLPHQSIDQTRQELATYLQSIAEKSAQPEVLLRTRIEDGDEASVIVDTAVAEQSDLIVMSTHGRTGFSRWYLGSVAERVMQSAPCPVLIVRGERPFARVLITLDGSELAERALLPGFALASCFNSEVTLMQVEQPVAISPIFISDLEAQEHGLGSQARDYFYFRTQRYLDRMAQQHQSLISQEVKTMSLTGPVADTILETIEKNEIDLLVMATHGRTGLRRWVFGSIAEKVAHHAQCAVLVVRPPEEALN